MTATALPQRLQTVLGLVYSDISKVLTVYRLFITTDSPGYWACMLLGRVHVHLEQVVRSALSRHAHRSTSEQLQTQERGTCMTCLYGLVLIKLRSACALVGTYRALYLLCRRWDLIS